MRLTLADAVRCMLPLAPEFSVPLYNETFPLNRVLGGPYVKGN